MEGLKFSSNTMQVSFVCQRCSQPLKLDTSFNVLDRMTIHELTGMTIQSYTILNWSLSTDRESWS
uniref:Uncharacterized protein n=1 Tax=Sinocyclocheilus rhinocerous TaxID=307959 RepID=A0A673K3H1_9TELE